MKSMGIVRKTDNLGRIVLPVELRRQFDIAEKDDIEIYTEDDKIILKKYAKSCVFCNNTENTVEFKDHMICKDCAAQIKDLM